MDHRRAPHRPAIPANTGAVAATRATALLSQVVELIPAPPAALAGTDAAWCGFEALIDGAAAGLAAAIGPEGRPALEAVMGTPLDAGPVFLLLVERTLGALARSPR